MVVIQKNKNGRTFFVNKDFQLTWMKDSALLFKSKEDVLEKISENRFLELILGEFYKIVNYCEAKNH
jgi:hypothetical protein